MRRALPWLVLAGDLAVSVGVFFALFAAPATDDYAGWSLALPALTLPSWAVLLRRRDPLGPVGALALALPGGASLGCVVASLVAFVRAPDIAQAAALVLFGPVLALVVGAVLWQRTRGLATRDAVRRVAVVVGAPALLALLAQLLVWRDELAAQPAGRELSFDGAIALALVLLDLLPLAWALACGLAWWATAPRTGARPTR